jgi:DNA-binding response OmpR family regulator
MDSTLSKEYLLQELSYDDRAMSEGSLRVHINKLRKIGLPIVTIKGVGYRLGKS